MIKAKTYTMRKYELRYYDDRKVYSLFEIKTENGQYIFDRICELPASHIEELADIFNEVAKEKTQ